MVICSCTNRIIVTVSPTENGYLYHRIIVPRIRAENGYLYTIAHSKRRPERSVVFECALATVTLQPINLLCYILQTSFAGLRYIQSAIERCKGVKKIV